MVSINISRFENTLHRFAASCLFNIDMKEPDYETMVGWTKLFQDRIIDTVSRYRYKLEYDEY